MRGDSALALVLLASVSASFLLGCSGPSSVNIELRKQNQTLQEKVDQLTVQHKSDQDALAACQRSHPTTATLPPDQLAQLVTTHGLKIGTLTGGDNPDTTATSDSVLKVYAVPLDEDGVPIRAAGSFKIEAFDLQDPGKPAIGTWTFDQTQTRNSFYSTLMLYTYVLTCPWQTAPAHAGLTLRVTFNDALTGREFVQQVQTKVRPPSTRP
jgi:outer membrane murein-binding lipoprotein Lpp